jgi:hypothetical protein
MYDLFSSTTSADEAKVVWTPRSALGFGAEQAEHLARHLPISELGAIVGDGDILCHETSIITMAYSRRADEAEWSRQASSYVSKAT